ncbi:lipopolysaccharide biosynthesis protein [Mycolicibacterium phlei]|uniref:lipopolysaccharide biosynthesis protein n=1 Tax=Mycolicibacterium phlei TaxID=1771 RepID=UPI002351D74A|nr:lipopolysaccharide biosynthesis protein [Mycolicibacterium phlei]
MVTAIGQLLRVAVQAVGVVIMARILVPADFGLIAMVTAIVGVGEILRDFGLAAAAVQAPELSTRQRSNLFWLNTAFGFAVGAGVFLMSWPIADLYGDDRLTAVTQVIASTFLFNGIASQYRASLQRELKFTWLVMAELVGLTLAVGAGIAGGLLGWGYWALVAQYTLFPVVFVVELMIASKWLPRGFYRRQNTRHFVRFGWHVMAYQLLTYASKNVDSVAIGMRFGAAPLGFYNRAFQLLTVPLNQVANPLMRVAVPVLAKVQENAEKFNVFLAKGQSALLAGMLFVLLSLGALSEPAVEILLGSEWGPTAGIFRILAIAGVFQILSFPSLWAFLALGLTRVNLIQALITRPLLILLVIVAAFFSVESVAVAYAVGTAISWPVALIFLSRSSDVEVLPLLKSSLRILFVNIVASLVAFSTQTWIPAGNAWISLGIGISVMGGTLAICVAAVPSLRREYASVLGSIRGAVRKAG